MTYHYPPHRPFASVRRRCCSRCCSHRSTRRSSPRRCRRSSRDLGGLDQLSWVVTAYLLGATVSMPLWGRLATSTAASTCSWPRSASSSPAPRCAARARPRPAGRLPRAAGPRRRRADDAGDGDRRRHRRAARARPLPGLHPARLRRGQRRRPAARRPVRRPRVLALGLLRQPADRRRRVPALASTLPALRRAPSGRIDYLGAALLAGAPPAPAARPTWRPRYAWDSPSRSASAPRRAARRLRRAGAARAPSPCCRCGCSRSRCSTSSRAALFLTTLAFFAVIVFMPVFLQTVTGVTRPSPACCCCRCCSPVTVSTRLRPRDLATGRYKRFPLPAWRSCRRPARALAWTRDTVAAPIATALLVFGARLRPGLAGPDVAVQNARRPPRPRRSPPRRRTSSARSAARSASPFGAIFAAPPAARARAATRARRRGVAHRVPRGRADRRARCSASLRCCARCPCGGRRERLTR